MRGHENCISEDEFEALPPALRRKCFSSLERLRLVQSTISTRPAAQLDRTLSWASDKRSHGSQSPPAPSRPRLLSVSTSSLKRLSRRSSTTTPPLPSSEATAWFLSLPPAVQRKQFTPEEQLLLSSRRDSVLLDAADEAFYRRGRQAQQHLAHPSRSPSPSAHFSLPSFGPPSGSGSFYDDTEEEMDAKMYDDFRWLDEEEELDLSLDNYHAAVKETTPSLPTSPKHKAPARRHLSLSNISFRRASTSSQRSSAPSPAPTATSLSSSRHRSSLISPRHQRSQTSVSIEPRARHYQDPEARLKLRVYLASPQKFDEAIEFGFPSTQDRLHYARPKTSPRLTHESGGTFFTDDTPSLSTDDEEKEPDFDVLDPRTPEDPVFRPFPSHDSSDPPATKRLRVVRGSIEPYACASATDREMTLHMTLTRPDLRGPDEAPLPPVTRVNDEPLEQSELPLEDVQTSIWDTLPEEGSRMKKMWKKLIHK